mmetsp:Transcript_6452/g.11212  ORF Transcript_6452/g.11212 Transcript_6452/m.11212 type:complete len:390 (+) Transcript_6452:81-1250(+)
MQQFASMLTQQCRSPLVHAALDIIGDGSQRSMRARGVNSGSQEFATGTKVSQLLQMPEIALEVVKTAGLRPAASLCAASRQHAESGRMAMKELLQDIDRYVDCYVCASGHTVERMQGAMDGRGWVQMEPRPTLRDDFAVASYNRKLYVIGGMAAGGCSEFVFDTMEEYDTATGTWRELPNMPKARHNCSATAADGKIYVIGGQHSCTTVNTVSCYDIETGTWSELPNMNHARAASAAVHVDGELYVAGGIDGNSTMLASVEKLDKTTGQWIEVASMPTARKSCGAIAINGKLYVLGGRGADYSTLAAVEAYDPALGVWEVMEPMPVPRRAFLVSMVGGSVFVVGGNFETAALQRKSNATQRWNTKTGEWTVLPSPVCHSTLQGGGLFIQ